MENICKAVRECYDEYKNQECGEGLKSLIEEHLLLCRECKQFYNFAEILPLLISEDKKLNEFSYNLHDEIMNKLYVEGKKSLFYRILNAFSTIQRTISVPVYSIIILLIFLSGLFIVFNLFNKKDSSFRESVNSNYFVIETGKEIEITLTLKSLINIPGAEVHINIEKGLEFATNDEEIRNKKTLSCLVDLEAGINSIPVVIRGLKPGKWQIHTVLIKNNEILVIKGQTIEVKKSKKEV